MLGMKHFRLYKTYILVIFSFLLGCMITINLTPINKTCRIDDSDREYNIMRNSKLKNPDLVILILSSPKNLPKRNTIRQTWLRLTDFATKFKIKHYFVVGSLGLSVDQVLHLSAEQSEFDDILLLPMYDSYQNLTQKVLSSFEWLDEQFNYGLGYKYVLKCDDDSFVRLDKLAQEVVNLETQIPNVKSSYISANLQSDKSESPDLYWGYFSGKARVQNSGKWRESNWITCDKYVPYALGGGYVLSKNLVTYLAKNAPSFRKFNSEDTSVGLWLAPINNILRVHDIRFDTEWKTRGCQNHYLITHSISAARMGALYDNIVRTGNLCGKEEKAREAYLYDWGVPPSQCCAVEK